MNDTLIPHVRKVYFVSFWNFFRRMVFSSYGETNKNRSSLVLNKTGVWRR